MSGSGCKVMHSDTLMIFNEIERDLKSQAHLDCRGSARNPEIVWEGAASVSPTWWPTLGARRSVAQVNVWRLIADFWLLHKRRESRETSPDRVPASTSSRAQDTGRVPHFLRRASEARAYRRGRPTWMSSCPCFSRIYRVWVESESLDLNQALRIIGKADACWSTENKNEGPIEFIGFGFGRILDSVRKIRIGGNSDHSLRLPVGCSYE